MCWCCPRDATKIASSNHHEHLKISIDDATTDQITQSQSIPRTAKGRTTIGIPRLICWRQTTMKAKYVPSESNWDFPYLSSLLAARWQVGVKKDVICYLLRYLGPKRLAVQQHVTRSCAKEIAFRHVQHHLFLPFPLPVLLWDFPTAVDRPPRSSQTVQQAALCFEELPPPAKIAFACPLECPFHTKEQMMFQNHFPIRVRQEIWNPALHFQLLC